jgi:Fe-S cluster biogenesis protein NfuA
MKMGIERILKENFKNLGSIIAVDPQEASQLTIEKLYQSIEKLLPAVKALGGSVEIVNVEQSTGEVRILFQGPERLKKGLDLVLKDNSLVKSVVFC